MRARTSWGDCRGDSERHRCALGRIRARTHRWQKPSGRADLRVIVRLLRMA